jgi:hypothetical protein
MAKPIFKSDYQNQPSLFPLSFDALIDAKPLYFCVERLRQIQLVSQRAKQKV